MGDRKLLEDAIFRNCQFLQAGHMETIKLAGHVQRIGTCCDSEKFPGKEKQLGSGILPGVGVPLATQYLRSAFASILRAFSQLFVAVQQ